MLRVTVSIVAVLAFLMSSYVFVNSRAERFVYVNNNKILLEYEGFKEAKIKATNKAEKWKSEVDSLKLDYTRLKKSYEGKELKKGDVLYLESQYKRILSIEQDAIRKIKNIEEELTQEVVNQIDIRIKEFGDEHDYEMIFGVTDSGNLLYSKEGKDITDYLLNYLNSKYRGK